MAPGFLSGDGGEGERYAGSVSIFVSGHTGFQRHQAFPDVDGQIDSLIQSPKFRQHFVTKGRDFVVKLGALGVDFLIQPFDFSLKAFHFGFDFPKVGDNEFLDCLFDVNGHGVFYHVSGSLFIVLG